jgi:hypothetical protein
MMSYEHKHTNSTHTPNSGHKDKALEVVEVFSNIQVPQEVFNASSLKNILGEVSEAKKNAIAKGDDLSRALKNKEEASFFDKIFTNYDKDITASQISLNQSISQLTLRSTDLLVVNTYMATVLNNQQKLLIQQQNKLEEQAELLFMQNEKIFAQQTLLENQQKEINKANQGLLEAKGLTQEQAQQLVGCIVKVQQAENRIKEDTAQQINNFKSSQEQINTDLMVKFDRSKKTTQELVEKIKLSNQAVNEKIEQSKKATEDEIVKIVNKIKRTEEQFNQKLILEIAKVNNEHQAFVKTINQQIKDDKKAIEDELVKITDEIKRTEEQFNQKLMLEIAKVDDEHQSFVQAINKQIEENKKATEDEIVKIANKIKLAEEQFNEKLMLEIARVDDEHQSFVQAINKQIKDDKNANEDKFIKVEYFDNKINLLELAHQKYRKQNHFLLSVLTFLLLISLILTFMQSF